MTRSPSSKTIPRRFKSVETLAARMRLDRRTVAKILALPGAPPKGMRGWDEAEVLAFARNNTENLTVLTRVDDDFRDLKKQELRLRIEAREFALAREQGEYLKKTDVLRDLAQCAAEMRATLYQKFLNELPTQLEGLEAREIRVKQSEALNEVLRKLSAKADEYKPDPTPNH